MKFNRLFHYIFNSLAIVAFTMFLQGCSEDKFVVPDYTITGDPVTLKIGVTLPVMDVQTRANLDEASMNQIESLWIRTYNAQSGEATSDWYKAEEQEGFNGNSGTEIPHHFEIETQSGSSYIVAVANVNNLGVTRSDITNSKPLSELLENADTWNDFLNLAVVTPSTLEGLRAPLPPLAMSGCYSDLIDTGKHPEPARIDEWQNTNFQPFFIPSNPSGVTFTGAIHLRRLVSHLNFNIIPGNENIDVKVNSYRVMNVPRFSWLYERPEQNGMMTNFGDQATSESDATNYYADVTQFGSQFIINNADGSSSFDFWQAENKHTGTCDTYSARDQRNLNTPSLFTSLTGDTWTSNNEASYVIIDCSVDYKNQISVGENGNIEESGTPNVFRSGEVTYLVHLGYVIGNDYAVKSKDFNCFRNVDYTYNITVNGLNDIVLDAHALDATAEIYHGEEGTVVDLANNTIDIDAHYAAFNIQLTQTELSGDFGFIITTYDNGSQITITEANTQRGSGSTLEILDRNGNVIDPKYYNWIELRPTTGENVLAGYKPRFGANADGQTCLLSDLKSGSLPQGMNAGTNGWYTVFVNEYTYEPIYTGTDGYANEEGVGVDGRPNWMSYVNQNPRRFYIRVTQSTSPDGNSVYARSKYGVSQQSMMTYYSDQTFAPASGNIPAGTAIGVERENETNGMNLRHTYNGGSSTANGRWNTAQYLSGAQYYTTNLTINSATETSRPQWNSFITYNSPLEVGAVTGLRTQGGPDIPARTIANGNPHKIPKLVISNSGNYTFSDPQANNTYRIEAINACTSRNRDNNGNGRIEPDELRWFVPALDQYLAIMLGEASLPEPLMPYNSISRLPYVNGNSFSDTEGTIDNSYYSRYMAIASNRGNLNTTKCVMWLMEGTSISSYNNMQSWSDNNSYPWTIRCIRNLGSNLTTAANEDRVSKPYTHDATNRKITMDYFNLSSIRANRYTSNGTSGIAAMPVHTIASQYNSLYRGFEYASSNLTIPDENRPEVADEDEFFKTYDRLESYINTNPCGATGLNYGGTGWRVPNQEELTIMRNLGILTASSDNTTWLSCTVNYFNRLTGVGSVNDTSDRLFLVVTRSQGTQLTLNNLNDAVSNGFYIRCVRDINN